MSGDFPLAGSHWQDNNTDKVYRVIGMFKGAKALHGTELIGYLEVESGEYHVRFASDWHEDFTRLVFGRDTDKN